MAESATRGAPRPIWRPGSLASLLRAASRPLRWSSGALLLATALASMVCRRGAPSRSSASPRGASRPRRGRASCPGTPLRSAIAVVLLLAVGQPQLGGVSALAAGACAARPAWAA